MQSEIGCMVVRKGNTVICETHGVRVVDRAGLEKLGLHREHPPVGNMFCPVSGKGFAFSEEAELLDL